MFSISTVVLAATKIEPRSELAYNMQEPLNNIMGFLYFIIPIMLPLALIGFFLILTDYRRPTSPEPPLEPSKLDAINRELTDSPSIQQLRDIQARLRQLGDSPEVNETRQEVDRLIIGIELASIRRDLIPVASDVEFDLKARRLAEEDMKVADPLTDDIQRKLDQAKPRPNQASSTRYRRRRPRIK